MAMSLDDLRALVDGEGLRYFIDPAKPRLLLSMSGLAGGFRCVISLQLDNSFLQLRTVEWLRCLSDHPHLAAVLGAAAAINYSARLVKIGWDPHDGELVAYADVWLMDAALTRAQLHRILANYFPVVDSSQIRFKKIMESGADPGPIDMAAAGLAKLAEPGLPTDMRKALEEALKSKGSRDPGRDDVPDAI